ncbi:protoheme IX farnesyltransferase [Chloroflexia bacterium SDU3-3]|nr:protoheme IX farnesyltransferase [Chloroflexia bacterium SDU3-3]
MQQERTHVRPLVWALAMGLALFSYAAVLVSLLLPAAAATALSGAALAVLGGAVGWQVWWRTAPAGALLGGQAQATWRRQKALAALSLGAVYATLVLGTLAASSGAMWQCPTWPTCAITSDLALLAMVHRSTAALGTILVLALALLVLLGRAGRTSRVAAGAALGLLLAQNGIGLVQVLLAMGGGQLPFATARLLHMGVGALSWAAVVALAVLVVRTPPLRRAKPAPAEAAAKQPSLLADYVSLTKPGVISLLIFTTFAAMFITPRGAPDLWLVVWTMVGGWLMPAGAHAMNCYFDRDIDVLMGRTGRRPIPSGRIPAWHALALGIALGVVAFVILAALVNMTTALLALAGYIYYVVFYTLILKRNTPQNIVIGGGAGAFPPMVGWAATTGEVSMASLLLFMLIFYWTPPHFWALALIRQKDYANAGVPMLPVVAGDEETKKQIALYTVQMVIVSLLLVPVASLGLFYAAAAAGLGGWFFFYIWKLFRNDSTPTRWALYRFSLIYLFLLFVAMMVDRLAFA